MGYFGTSVGNKPQTTPQTFPIGNELVGFPSMIPGQAGVNDALAVALQNLLSGKTGGSAGGFKPSMAGDFSPYGGAVGGALQSALIAALSGEVPAEAFATGVADPARRGFREETAPAIREEFAGPGTFWGTARADKVTGERERMETGLVEQSARMVEGALGRAIQAMSPALSAQMSRLQMAYNEYIRQNPAMSEALTAALNYLGTPLLATYQPTTGGGSSGNMFGSSTRRG
jgi:hypothetical protein